MHKTWKEDFLDEDTGTVVQIDRNSLLFTRGTVITQDVLAKIRFHMDAGEIKEVEVSNQQRVAFELKNTLPQSYMAQKCPITGVWYRGREDKPLHAGSNPADTPDL